ncbi:MAG: discoidin domain-containing protein [Thermoguttaceae bacterium]|nr:discoidin domain-containing protein [Thermoguttaceae bacterium]
MKRFVSLALTGVVLASRLCLPAEAGTPAGAEGPVPADRIAALVEAEWIADDRRFNPTEVAREHSDRVTTAQDAAGAVDGVKDSRWGFHVQSGEEDPWWQVDLTEVVPIERVVVYNRTEASTAPRARNLRILVAEQGAEECTPQDFRIAYQHDGSVFYGAAEEAPLVVTFDEPVEARVVRLMVPGRCSFALVEVEVYAAGAPETNIALGRPADQKSVHPTASSPGTKGHPLPEPPDGAASSIDHTRAAFSIGHTCEVLDRAAKLAARLDGQADPERLRPLVERLEAVTRRAEKAGEGKALPEAARQELYVDARRLLRQIAWTNPLLLEIDKLLFVKRHDPGGLFHMVHQYYGFGAKPGGGLYVLSDPFSDNPKLIDLLAESRVENGRLAGRRLVPGAFLAPEVSYDGKTILFPYTEGLDSMPDHGVWSPEACYHIFRVNADGSGLVQLTDGAYNEFDPCFLPDGRIAFISERRGGFLRCGGSAPRWPSPNYTLHSMEPDGSDIITLSYHETQEWNPSVSHDGMLVYTRWDYVDRDTNVAHHKWICYPDGRDPRAFHGNYPTGQRSDRPWMEMQIRAIPGSHRYVAVAAAHHGHEFGSLVLIDLRPEDDGAMSQLTRLTPEVPFPESEGRPIKEYMVYGTPWPLSEDDYLVVYDAEGAQSGTYNRGIYWMDRFGNRELIYRDPEISCYAPMPLRPRPRPPVIPRQTVQAASDVAAAGGKIPPATVAVMNVYDSQFDWPAETDIRSLRIIHVLPKTTSPANQPRIGVASGANARAVLGTVPVEADGSAYFEAPVGKSIYFQALNAEGMAVQSMRSGTYVHPGEQLTCQGCHERKHTPPELGRNVPLALRRSPSPIEPEPDGSNPFSYMRLVQPVLDRHCVACHRQEGAIDLSGVIEAPHGFSRSYTNLAGKYGFYYNSSNGSFRSASRGGARTEPGKFGALAAGLTQYLGEDHYGVKLTEEERRRVIVWLDANSDFFGVYENTEAQSRGEVVYPSLD